MQNEIIKDATFIGTKAECVLDELVSSGNNIFKQVSEAFTNEKSKYKIKFTAHNRPSTTEDVKTALPDSNGIIEIRINLANASTSPAISLASTILHETIHAELHRIKLTNNVSPNSLPTAQYDWYVKMWKFYEGTEDNINEVATAAEHNYMTRFHINPIAKGLKEYDNNSHLVENYMFFAWEGLEYYGKQNNYTTANELTNLANLTVNVHTDDYTSPCD